MLELLNLLQQRFLYSAGMYAMLFVVYVLFPTQPAPLATTFHSHLILLAVDGVCLFYSPTPLLHHCSIIPQHKRTHPFPHSLSFPILFLLVPWEDSFVVWRLSLLSQHFPLLIEWGCSSSARMYSVPLSHLYLIPGNALSF